MIKRIVKMTFRENHIEDFKTVFKESKQYIRNFEGCHHLELWQQTNNPSVFFTYSMWESEKHLDAYRHSELFKTTWAKTKPLFEAKAEAWSVDGLEFLP
ncbi:MAG: antibiotic biosynthesis monooxygenase family protein [Saprospiraceae bacterium]